MPRNLCATLLSALLVLLAACSDGPVASEPPTAELEPSFTEAARDHVPPREEDGATWHSFTDTELWDYVAELDSTVVVGLKEPGERRGVWRAEIFVSGAERSGAITALDGMPGVQVQAQSETLPIVQLRVESEDALTRVRAAPFTDYVEPGRFSGRPASWGCGWGDPVSVSDTTSLGDALPDHFLNSAVQIRNAWLRSDGSDVVVGVLDTGVAETQSNLIADFATGMSTGRQVAFQNTASVPSDGKPAWHDRCGHGTRMAATAVGPKNGVGIVGAAFSSDLVNVRFQDDVWMDQTLAVVDGLQLAATLTPSGITPHQRRVVLMAFGSANSYSSLTDLIQHLDGQPDPPLMVAASGTVSSIPGAGNLLNVVYPARRAEVIAVSAIKNDYTRHSDIVYGSDVELAFFVNQFSQNDLPTGVRNLGGSSGATAVVGGIAALVWSYHPTDSRDQIRQRLRTSAHNWPGNNSTFGYGVPNAMRAVGGMHAVAVNGPENALTHQVVTLEAAPSGGGGPFTYEWSTGATTSSINWSTPDEGPHHLSVTVTDQSDGHVVMSGKTVFVWEDAGDCPECIIPPN